MRGSPYESGSATGESARRLSPRRSPMCVSRKLLRCFVASTVQGTAHECLIYAALDGKFSGDHFGLSNGATPHVEKGSPP
jgi:hypothetical protein